MPSERGNLSALRLEAAHKRGRKVECRTGRAATHLGNDPNDISTEIDVPLGHVDPPVDHHPRDDQGASMSYAHHTPRTDADRVAKKKKKKKEITRSASLTLHELDRNRNRSGMARL
jgi:hypothetical protein